jgi:hypothetical protein
MARVSTIAGRLSQLVASSEPDFGSTDTMVPHTITSKPFAPGHRVLVIFALKAVGGTG